jgi:hypothetical protein
VFGFYRLYQSAVRLVEVQAEVEAVLGGLETVLVAVEVFASVVEAVLGDLEQSVDFHPGRSVLKKDQMMAA